MNCTYFLDDSSWPSEFGYRYNCFKQDPYFGYGTIGIMFLPGPVHLLGHLALSYSSIPTDQELSVLFVFLFPKSP